MPSILYESNSPKREVHYLPRTADDAPKAWVVVPDPAGHEKFKRDLADPKSSLPSLVKVIEASGLAADVVADMWDRYGALRAAVAEAKDPAERWKAWASGKLAVRSAVEMPVSTQRQSLLLDLADQETALRQQYGSSATLHPVALAMRGFMHGQEQLGSLNGSTPKRELLPDATFVDPIEVVGMVALDLAMQPDLVTAD
jgi:hypothetical protein